MKKSRPDYFSTKPVRGSSPTASLAADLSQNFHIDQRCVLPRASEALVIWSCIANFVVPCSPQLATPRRSLFSANLFGPENGRGMVLLCVYTNAS